MGLVICKGAGGPYHICRNRKAFSIGLDFLEGGKSNPFFKREVGLLSFSAFPTGYIQTQVHEHLPLGLVSCLFSLCQRQAAFSLHTLGVRTLLRWGWSGVGDKKGTVMSRPEA